MPAESFEPGQWVTMLHEPDQRAVAQEISAYLNDEGDPSAVTALDVLDAMASFGVEFAFGHRAAAAYQASFDQKAVDAR